MNNNELNSPRHSFKDINMLNASDFEKYILLAILTYRMLNATVHVFERKIQV